MPLSDNSHDRDDDVVEFSLTPQVVSEPKKPRKPRSAKKQATKPLPRVDAVTWGPEACLQAIFQCTNVIYVNAGGKPISPTKNKKK